jgi:DNA-binding transcriptional LysR family regulator
MRFDVTDLRLFLAVAEAGGITGRLLGRPVAGRQRAAARDGGHTEVRLLDRGRRGVTTTQAGEALVYHARLTLHQMSRMRGDIEQ